MAVRAIKAKIPGIDASDVKRSVDECFQKEWPDQAGLIAVQAIQANESYKTEVFGLSQVITDFSANSGLETPDIFQIVTYALEDPENRFQSLPRIFESLMAHTTLQPIINDLLSIDEQGTLQDIFKAQGVEWIQTLCDRVQQSLFTKELHKELNPDEPRTNAV